MKILAACTLASAIALSASAAFAQTRVACVGDSITNGYGLQSGEKSYPSALQLKLGSAFDVRNFGENGSTAQKGTDNSYWDREKFRTSSEFRPQIVVLMLGTNDAKPHNWNAQRFETDYLALAAHYRALGANLVMVAPPPVYGDGGFSISPALVKDEVVPRVRTMASAENAPLVEVFTALSGHPEWFPDTVHPNAAGADALAQTVAAVLTGVEPGTGVGGGSNAGGSAGGGAGGGKAAGGMGGVAGAVSSGGQSGGGGRNTAIAGASSAGAAADTGAGAAAGTSGAAAGTSGASGGASAAAGTDGAEAPTTDAGAEGCSFRLGQKLPSGRAQSLAFLLVVPLLVARRRRR